MAHNSTKAKADTQQFLTDSDFFDNVALCDVQVHFSGTYLHAHKYQLAKYSPWFFQAFTSAFPVATSNTIDLGSDDSSCLVFALLRHIYSLSYLEILYDPSNHFPQVPSTSTPTTSPSPTTSKCLSWQINTMCLPYALSPFVHPCESFQILWLMWYWELCARGSLGSYVQIAHSKKNSSSLFSRKFGFWSSIIMILWTDFLGRSCSVRE